MRKLGWRPPERRRLIWPWFALAAVALTALGAGRIFYDQLFPPVRLEESPAPVVIDTRETEAAIAKLQADKGAPAYFMGYACQTADCGGHKAGFAWAQKYNYQSPSDCPNNSPSFREGCLAYVAK